VVHSGGPTIIDLADSPVSDEGGRSFQYSKLSHSGTQMRGKPGDDAGLSDLKDLFCFFPMQTNFRYDLATGRHNCGSYLAAA
jgi:hypothetical protein